MRRFIITSQRFDGIVELIYNADGLLCSVSFTEVRVNKDLVNSFLTRAIESSHVDNVNAFIKGTQATCIEADFEVSFQMFWSAYDKKINKKRCEQLWASMHKEKQVKAWAGVKAYDKYLKSQSWNISKADPEKYLRNEYWENEYK